jgi:hypothetical protein
MTSDPHNLSSSVGTLSHRIRELLPQIGSPAHEGELVTHLHQLENQAEKKDSSDYTVPTHLRRIFAILTPLESPAANEAKLMIKNYAASAKISL